MNWDDFVDDEVMELAANCPDVDPETYRPVGEPAEPPPRKLGRNSRLRLKRKQRRAKVKRDRQGRGANTAALNVWLHSKLKEAEARLKGQAVANRARPGWDYDFGD